MLGSVTEEIDIVISNLFSNLNGSTINSSEKKTTIKGELHVRGTGSFSSCSRDMLRDIGSRNDEFGERDGVVWQEDDLIDAVHVRVGQAGLGDWVSSIESVSNSSRRAKRS